MTYTDINVCNASVYLDLRNRPSLKGPVRPSPVRSHAAPSTSRTNATQYFRLFIAQQQPIVADNRPLQPYMTASRARRPLRLHYPLLAALRVPAGPPHVLACFD